MKNLWKPSELQFYSFLLSMPIIDIVLNYILFDERIFSDIRIWLYSFPLIFLLGIGSWKGHVFITNWLKGKYPELRQTRIRIMLLILLVVPFMSFSVLCILFLYYKFSILGYAIGKNDIMEGLLVGFCVNLIFETLFEGDHVLQKYKESIEEKNMLQELALQQEFNTLKSQVNPHFLFNCFNSLSSLIAEDKQKAEVFLNELSKVYRYLLKNNEDGLSAVESEIRFVESYYKLLRTRHGEALKLNMSIDKRYESYLLPSMSLQLLIENVVKHNVLSKNVPLTIDIFTTEGSKLIINNNVQPRVLKGHSHRVGLDNIRAKYNLLGQQGFQVISNEKNFTVVLPLIWNNASENKKIINKINKTV